MKMLLSLLLKIAAITSLGYWWLWLLISTGYFYLMVDHSLWHFIQSGLGMTLLVFVVGMFCCQASDALVPFEEWQAMSCYVSRHDGDFGVLSSKN